MIAGGNSLRTGGSAREFKSQNTKGEIAMDFLSKLLQGISFVPALVTGIEKLLSGRSGEDKKDAALSFVQAALSISDAITNRQIVDEAKFKDGLSKVIDGTVECLNASMWAKQN
jgi:hypothetical protein